MGARTSAFWVVDKLARIWGPFPAEGVPREKATGGSCIAVFDEVGPDTSDLDNLPEVRSLADIFAMPIFRAREEAMEVFRTSGASRFEATSPSEYKEVLRIHQQRARAVLPGGEAYPKRLESKYRRDEPQMQRFLAALRQGAYVREARDAAGLKKADVDRWVDYAELGYAPYCWFPEEFERARSASREVRGTADGLEVQFTVSLETGRLVRPKTGKGYIYFVREGHDGPVKIGFAAKSVKKRIATLQTAHSKELVLLGSVSADLHAESEVQALFEGDRISGEWFQLTDRLARVIQELPRIGKSASTPEEVVAAIERAADKPEG